MQYLISPWSHQLRAIEKARDLSSYALFMEMGTGKTSAAINMLREKYIHHGYLLRTLIFAPPITLQNWKREWRMHSKIADSDIIVLEGSGAKRLKTFQTLGYQFGSKTAWAKIFITNYEALLMRELYQAFLAWGPQALVCDESHRLKDVKAKRTKAMITLADQVPYKYILTGTPVLNTPMDLFSQFRILDGGETFGKNFYFFRAEYFQDRNAGMRGSQNYFPNWAVKPGALERINSVIYRKAMRVKKEDCLDLPPLVRKTIPCELTPLQAKAYAEMKKDFITYLGDKACVAELALTKALRLLQMVSGFAKLETGDEREFEATPKMKVLQELLETLTPEHKVIVWAVFRENYAQIRKVCTDLGVSYVEVHGDVGSREKFANVDQFNTDPKTRVLVGHPGSGGIGINLVAASYSIFYSRNFSLEQDLQAEARNYRGGSEIHPKITRIDLVAKDTIDELVVKALAGKQAIGEAILKEWSTKL